MVSWNVEYLPALDINYWDENGDGLIERPNTDYSNEMRAVWESYLASMQYDPVQPGEAYLFVIPGITEGGDVRGYMPIKSRYGFVTADATTRDVAHSPSRESGNWATEFSTSATPFPQKIPLLCHREQQKTSWTTQPAPNFGNTNFNETRHVQGQRPQQVALVELILDAIGRDFIHNPEGGWHIFEDVEEGEMFDNYLSKNCIKNIIDGIRSDNIQDEEYSDLTLYAFSEGSATNLQLNSDLSLDYISVEVKSGKNIGIENPFIWQPLKIEPINIKQKTANTPPGEEEEFIKIYYNRIEEASLPVTGYIELDTVGISFILKESQRDDFLGYILNENLTDIILAQYSEAADTALSCAFSWSGNSMACNIGVRTAIYFYKNNQLLFPKSPGSGLFKSDQEPYLIGEITRPGKANDIYNDLENEELSEFETISNATGCSYPDFDELQNQANNGVVIIGVRENSSGSGHIVLIMPKSFNQGDEPTSFPIGVKTVKYPICLECGFGEKMTEPFRDKSNISEYVWYKY